MSEEITIEEIEKRSDRNEMRIGVFPMPIYNAAEISVRWHPRHNDSIFVADFSGIKFRRIDPFNERRSEGRIDSIRVNVDHLKIPIDQLIYSAGLKGYCETSKAERDSYLDQIKNLQEQNAKLTAMVAGVLNTVDIKQ